MTFRRCFILRPKGAKESKSLSIRSACTSVSCTIFASLITFFLLWGCLYWSKNFHGFSSPSYYIYPFCSVLFVSVPSFGAVAQSVADVYCLLSDVRLPRERVHRVQLQEIAAAAWNGVPYKFRSTESLSIGSSLAINAAQRAAAAGEDSAREKNRVPLWRTTFQGSLHRLQSSVRLPMHRTVWLLCGSSSGSSLRCAMVSLFDIL